jgi:hypothetical protein
MLSAQLDSLVYISTASAVLTEHDLIDIIETSQRNNGDSGITGLLCFNGTNFMQFLEGDRDMINARFSLIQSDERHNGIVVINRNVSEVREFPGWQMATSLIDTKDYGEGQELAELLKPDTVTAKTREVFNNFRSLGHSAQL